MKLICAFALITLCLVARSDSFDDIIAPFFQAHPEVNQTATEYGEAYFAFSLFYKNDPKCVATVKNVTDAKKEEYKRLYQAGNITLGAIAKDFVEVTLPNAVFNISKCLLDSERIRLFRSLDQQVALVFTGNFQAEARRTALMEQLSFLSKGEVPTNESCTEILGTQYEAAYILFALKFDNNKTTVQQIVAEMLNQSLPTFVKKAQLCLTGNDDSKFDNATYWYLKTNPDANATWLRLVNQFANFTSFQPHDEACAAPLRNIADMERQVKMYEFVKGKATIEEIITNALGSVLPALIQEARACLINNPYATVRNRTSFRFSRKI